MLYMAIVNVVSKSAPIQEARAALQPSILALLPAKEAAERFTFLTVSLVTLKSVHLDLGPEVSLAKLRAISDEMRQTLPHGGEELVDKVYSYFVRFEIAHGALMVVAKEGFTLPVDGLDVLLTRYQWSADPRKSAVHYLLRELLEAVATFRAAAEAATDSTSLFECLSMLKSAHDTLGRTVGTILDTHATRVDPTEVMGQRMHRAVVETATAIDQRVRARVMMKPMALSMESLATAFSASVAMDPPAERSSSQPQSSASRQTGARRQGAPQPPPRSPTPDAAEEERVSEPTL